jgi:hypothetical protein
MEIPAYRVSERSGNTQLVTEQSHNKSCEYFRKYRQCLIYVGEAYLRKADVNPRLLRTT